MHQMFNRIHTEYPKMDQHQKSDHYLYDNKILFKKWSSDYIWYEHW